MRDLLICSLGMDHKRITPNCKKYRVAPHSVLNSNSHISVFQEVGGIFEILQPLHLLPLQVCLTRTELFPMPKPFPLIITPHFIFGVIQCCFLDPKYFSSFIPSLILKLFNSPYVFFPPISFVQFLACNFYLLLSTFPVFTHLACFSHLLNKQESYFFFQTNIFTFLSCRIVAIWTFGGGGGIFQS